MAIENVEVNLRMTIKHLVTHKGRIQERLEGLVTNSSIRLTEFPEDLRPKWQKIWNALTAKGTDEGNEIGAVRNTLRSMENEEAEKIAEEIWLLWKETYARLPKRYQTL